MKAFNIVATAALFSATFSWAKKLDGLDTDFADKFNDALVKQGEKLREMIKSLESKV